MNQKPQQQFKGVVSLVKSMYVYALFTIWDQNLVKHHFNKHSTKEKISIIISAEHCSLLGPQVFFAGTISTVP